jgi:hypothetical protein
MSLDPKTESVVKTIVALGKTLISQSMAGEK